MDKYMQKYLVFIGILLIIPFVNGMGLYHADNFNSNVGVTSKIGIGVQGDSVNKTVIFNVMSDYSANISGVPQNITLNAGEQKLIYFNTTPSVSGIHIYSISLTSKGGSGLQIDDVLHKNIVGVANQGNVVNNGTNNTNVTVPVIPSSGGGSSGGGGGGGGGISVPVNSSCKGKMTLYLGKWVCIANYVDSLNQSNVSTSKIILKNGSNNNSSLNKIEIPVNLSINSGVVNIDLNKSAHLNSSNDETKVVVPAGMVFGMVTLLFGFIAIMMMIITISIEGKEL
jgi:hypothetical protein